MTNDSPFAKSAGAADIFKAAEHVNDFAIVFEFKRMGTERNQYFEAEKEVSETNQPTREVVFADIACFRNSEDVATATPSFVQQNAKIVHGVLVADVEREGWLGKATVQTIRKVKKSFVYRGDATNLTPEAEAAAIKWYTEREAAVAAVEIPDFAA